MSWNWIEIERQYKYIQTLQKILSDNDIPYPNEYDFGPMSRFSTS